MVERMTGEPTPSKKGVPGVTVKLWVRVTKLSTVGMRSPLLFLLTLKTFTVNEKVKYFIDT